jgi:hypothetical protein
VDTLVQPEWPDDIRTKLFKVMKAQQLEECVLKPRASIRRPLATVNPTLGKGYAKLC